MSTEPERALGSAHVLGTLCPDAGHMNHMPGHVYVPRDLDVFIRREAVKPPLAPPYDGPYRGVLRTSKTVTVERRGRQNVVSIDRAEPAHLDPADRDGHSEQQRPRPPSIGVTPGRPTPTQALLGPRSLMLMRDPSAGRPPPPRLGALPVTPTVPPGTPTVPPGTPTVPLGTPTVPPVTPTVPPVTLIASRSILRARSGRQVNRPASYRVTIIQQ